MKKKTYSYDEVREASLAFFAGDEIAADAFAGKYALQDGSGAYLEKSPTDMHRRLASEFARIEAKYPDALSEADVYELFSTWRIVPQGSPMSAVGNEHKVQSLSNCFVVPAPHDSYAGIMFSDQQLAQIMKRRGGVGLDISTIRPKGMKTANAAGTTDGIGIFMERFSNTCREVAQGGRRGALLLSISVLHPEIETFINIKRDLEKVTGANVSVRLTDAFMQAVEADDEFTLRWPVDVPIVDAKVTKVIKARSVWNQIIDSAWTSAEPGVFFWDTVVRETPSDMYADKGFRSVSTNPCVVGNTLISIADGRNAVSIRQLADEGKDVPVYSTNVQTGQVEIKWGRNPRLTGEKSEVWKLNLDDGSELIATPNHKILTRDLQYVELKDLKEGMSIFPFNSFEHNNYRQIVNSGVKMTGGARRNRRQYRLIHEFYSGKLVDAKINALHHVDFDSKNDRFDNLQIMPLAEHIELHASRIRGEKNPYHQMTPEWKQNFASHPAEKNGKWSGYTNEQLIEHGKKLFKEQGKITSYMWQSYAKQNNLPQSLTNKSRFKSWQDFANQVRNNHKVISVEFVGYEDVYNITVDDNHNYHVITSNSDNRFVTSSGICVKNCGEIVLSEYDACRLLLMNLTKYVVSPFLTNSHFDFSSFSDDVYKAQKLMDDLIDLEIEAIDRIISKIESDPEPLHVKRIELDLWNKIRETNVNGRRTGLGVTGLGDAVAMCGLKYGSDDSIELIEKIYRALAVYAHRSSVDMAESRGAFPVCEPERYKLAHPFFDRLKEHSTNKTNDKLTTIGRRNIALTTTAPAGTVSLLTQTTAGIEPAYKLEYIRRRKINPNDKNSHVDFTDDLGDKWQEYVVHHHCFKQWMDATGKSKVEDSPYFGATALDVDWLKGVELQAVAQKWIEHSISRTANLPKDASKELVSKVYLEAWKRGCKGYTIYREGSRSGVLVSADDKKQLQPATINDTHAPKRPKELECDINRVTIKGESYLVLVGLLNGRPYEVFAGLSQHVEVPKKCKKGTLIKNGKKDGVATYNVRIPLGDDDELLFKDIVGLFDNSVYGDHTRTISLALRHGTPVQYMCEQLKKHKNFDLQSFSSVVSRVLKAYITDGTKVTAEKKCPDCGSANLVYQSGCVSCENCPWSKCS